MKKPLLIVMTPVRNEAWVLPAFLKTTGLWADYIIIADQHSTDGSREIASSYPKVILVDNDNLDFNEAERQSLLINKAREIAGDKILFGLDADEILSANFMETNDWQKILNSKSGDVFWFKWAEIRPDKKTYWESKTVYYPWVFHDDGKEPHKNYVRNMHSMRIPYPLDEKQMYYVNDFRVLHLSYLNSARMRAKSRFYQFVDWSLNKRSIVSLSRQYSPYTIKEEPVHDLPANFIYSENKFGFNLFDLVDTISEKFWFDEYIIKRLPNYSTKEINKLNIWEDEFINNNHLTDNRNLINKLLHSYLTHTQRHKRNIVIKAIDKLLKKIHY